MSVAMTFKFVMKFEETKGYEKINSFIDEIDFQKVFGGRAGETLAEIVENRIGDDSSLEISYEDEESCSHPASNTYFKEFLKYIVKHNPKTSFEVESNLICDDENSREIYKYVCGSGELKLVQANPLAYLNNKEYKDLIFAITVAEDEEDPTGEYGDFIDILEGMKDFLTDFDYEDYGFEMEALMQSLISEEDGILACMPAYADMFISKKVIVKLIGELIENFEGIDFKVFARFTKGKQSWANNFSVEDGEIIESELDLTDSEYYNDEDYIIDLDSGMDESDYNEEEYDEDGDWGEEDEDY
jgi:hypothetical protein